MKDFGLFLLKFFAVFAVVLADGWITYEIIEQSASASYSSVTGVVTNSHVITHHSSRGGTTYSAHIEYHYEVNGQAFFNNRLRYGYAGFSSLFGSRRYLSADGLVNLSAHEFVNAHPVGSSITVYYAPGYPADSVLFTGLLGADFMPFLFLVIFNTAAAMAGVAVYQYLCQRIAKPPAAGVKFFRDGNLTRIRLSPDEAYLRGLRVTGYVGLGLALLLPLVTYSNPSIPLVMGALTLCGVVGLGIYLWRRSVIASGVNDLIINESARTLDLPATYERSQRVILALSDVSGLSTKSYRRPGNRKSLLTYAPILTLTS